MKIRNGFVSNSSSSSFCIVGVADEELIAQINQGMKKKYLKEGEEDEYDELLCEHFSHYTETEEGEVLGHDLVGVLEHDHKDLLEKLKQTVVSDIKEKSDIDVPIHKVRILSGSYPC